MAEKPSYLKAAFKRQENLIGLTGFCAAGLLFNPGFLFLAGAVEVAYLWLVAGNPRFQRVVDSESHRSSTLFGAKEKDRILLRLPGEERDRYLELAAVRQRVYDSWQARDEVSQGLLQPSVDKLDYLLDTFLRALLALNSMREHLYDTNRDHLGRQVQAIEAELKRGLPEQLRDAKARSLEILKARVARVDKLSVDMEVLKTQLDNIEHTIKLVSDQSISLSDPRQVTEQIESAVSEVGETDRSIREVEAFLGSSQETDKKDSAAQDSARQEQS